MLISKWPTCADDNHQHMWTAINQDIVKTPIISSNQGTWKDWVGQSSEINLPRPLQLKKPKQCKKAFKIKKSFIYKSYLLQFCVKTEQTRKKLLSPSLRFLLDYFSYLLGLTVAANTTYVLLNSSKIHLLLITSYCLVNACSPPSQQNTVFSFVLFYNYYFLFVSFFIITIIIFSPMTSYLNDFPNCTFKTTILSFEETSTLATIENKFVKILASNCVTSTADK